MQDRRVRTSVGTIAVAESAGDGPPVLFVHGNSSCKEVFRNQLLGRIGQRYRCVAMDLPGHGGSEDATDADATYTMQGCADVAAELMERLDTPRYAVVGWSLGGHVGLELLDRSSAPTGLLISGTPPVGPTPAEIEAGFVWSEHMELSNRRDLTADEVEAFARATCGVDAPYEPFLAKAVARTDGRARETMARAFRSGDGSDQRRTAIDPPVPLAIVDGGADPFIDHAYVEALPYRSLWGGRVHTLAGVGHAPFWEAPAAFDELLEGFLDSLGG